MLKLLYRRSFGTLPTTPIDIPVSAQADRLIVGVETTTKKASWSSAGSICQRYLSSSGWVESTPINIKLGAPQVIEVVPYGNYQIRFRPQQWLRDIDISISQDVAVIEPHIHEVIDVTGLQTSLDGKSPIGHSHVIADVTGLQSALNAKASLVHGHGISDVSGLQALIDDLYSPIASFPYGPNDYRFPVEGTLGGYTLPSGIVYFAPYFNRFPVAISELGMANQTTSTGVFRWAFYSMGANMAPLNLLWDSGDISGSSATWKYVSKPLTLQRGWYWIAVAASANIGILTCGGGMLTPLGGSGSAVAINLIQAGYSWTTSYSSAFPSVVDKSLLQPVTQNLIQSRPPYFCYR